MQQQTAMADKGMSQEQIDKALLKWVQNMVLYLVLCYRDKHTCIW
jgi:hypothetical protein